MQTHRWNALLARIVADDADDLGGLTSAFDPRYAPTGRDLMPEIDAVLMPQAALKRGDAVCIGLRVEGPLADAADRAMRLAAFAAERDVEVVVLAHADHVGLERFGFRVERIVGATPEQRARCEAQIRRLWNIDLVL
ncbi:MAG: hypothetical protein GVY33_16940 [Alphaproteobacteria bacterium]|jgi:hypothetical protein|nr:hypothetical protein [Alphaproteobacteria bacterium]